LLAVDNQLARILHEGFGFYEQAGKIFLERFFAKAPLGLTRYFVPDKISVIKPHGQTVTELSSFIVLQLIELSINPHCFGSAFVQYAG